MVIARIGIALVVSAVVTFALLFLMQALIATGRTALTDDTVTRFVDFVRVRRDENLQTKENKPEKPPVPEQPPPDMPEPQQDNIDPNAQTINIAPVSMDANVDVGGIGGFVAGEGDYLPIVKVAPIYPRRAQTRGIEGYVVLEYTVTRQGTVKDVRVVEAQPQGIFDKAAIASAQKYKYKPRVVNGEALEVPGVQTIIRFELEN